VSAIDNIFIDNSSVNSFAVSQFINGLADQDAHYVIFRHVFVLHKCGNSISRIILVTNDSLIHFINMLKNESWDDAFFQNYINRSFSSLFESSFSMRQLTSRVKNTYRMTRGIRISCTRKSPQPMHGS
jgi:hypothetical protein